MRRIAVLSLLLALLSTGAVFPAQEEGFGLGIILGEPTGVNFKAWAGYRSAFVGAAAWSFGNEDSLHVHLLRLAGDVNVHRGHTSSHMGLERVSIEQVEAYDPDVIIAQDKGFVEGVGHDPA